MDIILLQDVDTLGTAGDIVNVKPGYARNYLFPRSLALRASKRNLAIADERKRNADKRRNHDKKMNLELSEQLKDLEMTFEVQVGEEEKMFGAVTTNDIHKKLEEKHKIDPKLCVLVEDIARNLKPAYEMGMKTIWIKNDEPWASKFSDSNFVNYRTNNLTEFLRKINLLKAA